MYNRDLEEAAARGSVHGGKRAGEKDCITKKSTTVKAFRKVGFRTQYVHACCHGLEFASVTLEGTGDANPMSKGSEDFLMVKWDGNQELSFFFRLSICFIGVCMQLF